MKFKKAKIRQVFGRQLKAKDLYNKQVFWRFIAEWFGTYEDIGKISDKLLDITFEQIKSTKTWKIGVFVWLIVLSISPILLNINY